MHKNTFKGMRRFLPITRQKMNWNPSATALASQVILIFNQNTHNFASWFYSLRSEELLAPPLDLRLTKNALQFYFVRLSGIQKSALFNF